MTTAPIRKTLTVPLRPDAAFDLFARGLKDGWRSPPGPVRPPAPRGRITAWEPGRRLAAEWRLGGQDTRWEVTFTAVADGTRVTLVHGGFDGPGGPATALLASARAAARWHVALPRAFRRATACAGPRGW